MATARPVPRLRSPDDGGEGPLVVVGGAHGDAHPRAGLPRGGVAGTGGGGGGGGSLYDAGGHR
jgi:hypothetical protein